MYLEIWFKDGTILTFGECSIIFSGNSVEVFTYENVFSYKFSSIELLNFEHCTISFDNLVRNYE